MTELRSQRGVSQKEAAEALGISQALLSHYEKGIRECGLDFLLKAASYYDVSCDYLLGRVDTRRQFHADFKAGDIEFDSEFRTSTIFRASTMIHDQLASIDASRGAQAKNYFALGTYQLILYAAKAGCVPKSWIKLPVDAASAMCRAEAEIIKNTLLSSLEVKVSKNLPEPMCIKTIIDSSERLISKEAETILNSLKSE